MKLFRITCKETDMSLITPEPSSVTKAEVLDKYTNTGKYRPVIHPVLCEPLQEDLREHGKDSFEVEILSTNDSGLKIAKLERLNLKMLGDLSYTNEPILAKMYNL